MFKFVALYRMPGDVAEFDQHYFGEHVPIVEATPGLLRSEISRVTRTLVGEPAYYLMAELYFADRDAFKAAAKTEPWAASGRNLQEWGGMELVTMFTAEDAEAGGSAGGTGAAG